MSAATPDNSAGEPTKLQLSQREIEVMAMAFVCISDVKDGVPTVDTKRLAQVGSYASADSARHVWNPIRKKLAAFKDTTLDPESFVAVAKSKDGKTAQKKRKTEADDGTAAKASPAKKPRAKKATKASAKKVVKDEDEAQNGDDKDGHLVEGEA